MCHFHIVDPRFNCVFDMAALMRSVLICHKVMLASNHTSCRGQIFETLTMCQMTPPSVKPMQTPKRELININHVHDSFTDWNMSHWFFSEFQDRTGQAKSYQF